MNKVFHIAPEKEVSHIEKYLESDRSLFRTVFYGILLLILAVTSATKAETVFPFQVNEKLTYTVRWEMVRAGKAVFQVLPRTDLDDQKVWHFSLDIRSNQFVDMLYKIRDRLDGYANEEFSHSLFYTKTQSGKDKKQIQVKFDWDNKTATYSNFGGSRDPVDIPLQTFDPLSAFYKMRTTNLLPGQTLSFPITDGKKQFVQEAAVIEKQVLDFNGKPVETFLIIPSVNHFSGVFQKSDNPTVRVWVSADEKKIPIRIKVKVFIGSVIFDLESAT